MSTAPQHAAIHATNALPKVVRAKGSYLWDATGKQYIDGSGGPGRSIASAMPTKR